MLDQRIIREATTHSPANAGVPTQVANPARAVLRTIVQALIALVPILNAVALVAAAYLGEQTDVTVPPVVFAILNGIIAVTALLIGLVTRVFAVPGVEAWLRKYMPGLTALRYIPQLPAGVEADHVTIDRDGRIHRDTSSH